MIRTQQVLRKGTSVLIGIGLDNAMLDIVTNDDQIRDCLGLLRKPHAGLVSAKMGDFGIYPATLNVHHDDAISICVDGPYFEPTRNQAAGFWLQKEELERLLVEALQGAQTVV